MNLYCKLYELKGYVESMSELAYEDDRYHNPLLEKVGAKMKEIISEIEKKDASESDSNEINF